jgi:transcriptional regulator with XRE-family HTH domain
MGAMLTREELGARIRELRRGLGLTQEGLAELASVSSETIGRLEQGVGSPNLYTVDKVALALRTTTPALIADRICEEVSALVDGLPPHEQEIACVMLRALSSHVNAT